MLVTGADGFVGSRLVPRLLDLGHQVTGAVRPGGTGRPVDPRADVVSLELGDSRSVAAAVAGGPECVVHLAAVSSGTDARKDPAAARETNAGGTRRLAEAVAGTRCRLLVVSTAEVYGPSGSGVPRVETDPTAPGSPYAESKLEAEKAAFEVHRRTGLAVIVARPFPHTGPGQDQRFVVPSFVARLREAKRSGARTVGVGNLAPVREFMHVNDVVEAYAGLAGRGEPGEVYNVASGRGISLEELFHRLCDLIGHQAVPEPRAAFLRTGDIAYLVGDSAKLRRTTGWVPQKTLEQTLAEVVSAQTD